MGDFLLLPLSIYSDIHVYAFTLFSFSFPEAFVVADDDDDDDDDDFRNYIQSQLRVVFFFLKFSSTERRELPKREMPMTWVLLVLQERLEENSQKNQ